jgi:hypothetical protein
MRVAPTGPVSRARVPMRRAAKPAAAMVAWSGRICHRAMRAATGPRPRDRVKRPSAVIGASVPAASEAQSAAAVGAGVVAVGAATAARAPATDSRQTLNRMDAARIRPQRVLMGRVPRGGHTRLPRRRPLAGASPPPAHPPRRLRRHLRRWSPPHPKRRAPPPRRSTWCGLGRGTLRAAARMTAKR